jgi:aminoglycoside phosphotransferase (APT) family kinase protein
MDIRHSSLPEHATLALLGEMIPGSTLCAIRPVKGEFYNRQFYLDARSKEGEDLHFVVKLYQGESDFCVRRARAEDRALRWLHLHHRPVPEPVFLDDTGALLGGPGLVTRFLPGSPILDPPYPPDWGRQMALTLASIHAYPCDASARAFLRDANREGLWFRRSGSIPAWMAADPDGWLVWEAIERLLPPREETLPRLCHTDFWGGNVLCLEGKITAVVDWEEAAYGDPGMDVAYCYMNLLLSGSDQDAVPAAEEFLSTYISVTGGLVANLTLWKFAAAARPMLDPRDWWIDRSPWRERFRRYIQEIVQEENLLRGPLAK